MISTPPERPIHPARTSYWLIAALLVGLAIRGLVLTQTGSLGTEIVDEQHYAQIAANMVAGHGFGWAPGRPTSIRPPLYPAFVSAIWLARGRQDLQAVRVVQVGLALLTTLLVYRIGARTFGARAARIAAALFWLYPSFIFFNALILTETLFTLLLVAFIYFTLELVSEGGRWTTAVLCGTALGLAALTRSILWPLPLLLCPLLLLLLRGPWLRRVAFAALVFAGYAAMVGPWAVRNTRLQGVVTVVDTMGGLNLRMGNYEHTPDDRMWDAVSLQGSESWSYELSREFPNAPLTEGQKDKWAQHKAIEYIVAHPGIFVRRAFVKFADFWGLEREFVAGVDKGMYHPSTAVVLIMAIATGISYPALVILGFIGLWTIVPNDRRALVILLLPLALITGIHTIVFGHSRYHLPLVPFLALYAGAVLAKELRSLRSFEGAQLIAAGVTCAMFVTIWLRQLAFVDTERLRTLLQHVA